MCVPAPAISKRNGTSIVPLSCPALTTTEASHRPASDCAPAGAATAIDASSGAAKSLSFIPCSSSPGWSRTFRTTPEKTKSPESDERFPGLLTAEPQLARNRLGRRERCGRSSLQAGEGSGQTTRAAKTTETADHVHACTFIVDAGGACQHASVQNAAKAAQIKMNPCQRDHLVNRGPTAHTAGFWPN